MLDMQDKFEIPKNVKQMGRGDNFLKVYIEDYVYTYLNQYSKYKKIKNKYAVLVGKIYKNQIEKFVVVKGLICCHLKASTEDTTIMLDRVKAQIEEEQKKYYPDYEIVGWMHATDEDIKKVFEFDNIFHRLNFSGNNKILYIFDYENDIEEIYYFRDNSLNKLQGFYIYYDKNQEMQNYMLDNKLESASGTKSVADFRSRPIITNSSNIEHIKKEGTPNIARLLAGLSFGLLVMCIIMGFGVVKSLQKINDVESKLTFLNEGYVMLQEKFKNSEYVVEVMNNDDKIGNNENSYTSTLNNEEIFQNADEEVVEAQRNKQPKNTKYVVKKGDNLNRISYIYYNTTSKAKDIMVANKLTSPDKIYVGQELIIPMD